MQLDKTTTAPGAATPPAPPPNGVGFIKLKQRDPIARGGRRLVYAHPYIDQLVLKVPRPEARHQARDNLPFWRRHFRRFKHYNDSVREAVEHVAAYAESERLPPFMQRFYGFLETDMGLASVSKAERGRDGNYAPNLRQLVQSGKFDGEARAAFGEFCEAFVTSDVVVGDLRMENLVYSHDAQSGKMRFVIIDGAGDKNGVKICSWIPLYNKLSKRKRISRLREKIRSLLMQTMKDRNDAGWMDGREIGPLAQ